MVQLLLDLGRSQVQTIVPMHYCPFEILARPNSSTKGGNSPISLRNFGRANWAAKQGTMACTQHSPKYKSSKSPSKLDEWA